MSALRLQLVFHSAVLFVHTMKSFPERLQTSISVSSPGAASRHERAECCIIWVKKMSRYLRGTHTHTHTHVCFHTCPYCCHPLSWTLRSVLYIFNFGLGVCVCVCDSRCLWKLCVCMKNCVVCVCKWQFKLGGGLEACLTQLQGTERKVIIS